MKTILIVIGGMADLPESTTRRDTPLVTADIPAINVLAQRGSLSAFPSLSPKYPVSHKNALLSILGYDLDRGEPSIEELMEYGLDQSAKISSFPSLQPFIIPGFSGHGVCITTSAWVRGVAKCAFIKPLDIYAPGSSDSEILDTVAELTNKAISGDSEFIFVYVDTPLKASLRGDYDAKIQALENIDRHLISPVADFVWKSDLFIHLAVTTDLTTSWATGNPTLTRVPVVTYFNNNDWDGDPEARFTEVESMLMEEIYTDPSDLIRYLISFDTVEEELPF